MGVGHDKGAAREYCQPAVGWPIRRRRWCSRRRRRGRLHLGRLTLGWSPWPQ